MNPRILKKLSKRAEQLLPLIYPREKITRIGKEDAQDCHAFIPCKDRRYWERSPCHNRYQPRNDSLSPAYRERKIKKVDGNFEILRPPSVPLKNTPIIVFESEEDYSIDYLWLYLKDVVQNHFTDYSGACKENGYMPRITKTFKSASDYLKGAREIIASKQHNDFNFSKK